MWQFADNHVWVFSLLAIATLLVIRSVFVSFARVMTTWGTRHCNSCACRAEDHDSHDGEDDEE